MKPSIPTALLLGVLAFPLGRQTARGDFPVLTGPYLGQKPPAAKPEVFAPGIVSTGLYTRDIAVSKDGGEIFFCVSDAALTGIFLTRRVGDRWTEPVVAPFSGKGFLDFEPALSPDGDELFFLSNRPPAGREPKAGWAHQNIWRTVRTGGAWGEPEIVGPPVSTESNEFFPSPVRDGSLYFTRSGGDRKARIYKSRLEGDRFLNPEMIPFDVPEEAALFNAFVSPGEDFLITCGLHVDPTNTDQDYYIAFRSPEGRWSRLIKLGPDINVPGDNANSAFVSPDGRFLFFSSSRPDPDRLGFGSGTPLRALVEAKSRPGYGASAIYWVEAKILAGLRPPEAK